MPVYTNSGITLGIDKTGSGTYTAISGITNIQPPQESVAEVDTTNYASAKAESRGGLGDPGRATVDIQFDPADANHAYLQVNQGVTKNWQITMPGTQDLTIEFAGYITGWSPNLNARGEVVTSQFTIKASGVVTYELESGS